ncbi:PLD2 [Symbiodinium sp. CCMP2592]|nr:PLD2 [Symbiodinium sp. CCMP2592]
MFHRVSSDAMSPPPEQVRSVFDKFRSGVKSTDGRRRSSTLGSRVSTTVSTSPSADSPRSPRFRHNSEHSGRATAFLNQWEKQRTRLRAEIKDWTSRLQKTGDLASTAGGPELVSVEPIVSLGEDLHQRTNGSNYRARLRLQCEDGIHAWSTEPFTLDELVRIVVRTRAASATRWCRSNREAIASGADPFWAVVSVASCAVRTCLFWAFLLWASWLLAQLLRRLVRESLVLLSLVTDAPDVLSALEPLIAMLLSFAIGIFGALLMAGLTEVSFIPAKAILNLERKAETEKVREQLALLLRSKDCLRNLDICNFLSLGMATYFNSSETHKEGRCFVRRHETTEDYFMNRRRQRCTLLCLRCDFRLELARRRGLQERWLVLRKDGIALFSSLMDTDPTDMLFFDTSFALFRDEEDHVLVKGASWVLELSFGDGPRRHSSAQGWCNAITVTAQLSTRTREQRYGSFAPIRLPGAPKTGDRHVLRRSLCRYLLNGRAIFRAVAEAILLAKHEIFILSFFLSPHIELVRDGDELSGVPDSKVETLLKAAADRGVRVYVLLYQETGKVIANASAYAENQLQHKNIFVMRHRSRFDSNLLWTHHEKVVVVDQQLAIVGGLDLCIGRYDDWRHLIFDAEEEVWKNQDYYNPRIKDVTDGRLQKDQLDRKRQARLPWQDVACELIGRPARDVARHCVERWNHARCINSMYHELPTALLKRKVAVSNDDMLKVPHKAADPTWPPERGPWQECRSQVVRSVGRWSAGTKTESSSHQAYCDLIQESKSFIYIENQFFCSAMEGEDSIGNRVLEALFRRIVKAEDQKEAFHCVIILPLLPALEAPLCQSNASQPVFRVMHAQYQTLRGLRKELRARGADEAKYISVFGLRTHGWLDGLGHSTEQIYIHSKAMVVDDEVAIIGSSNINDRSLLGMRDSEVNVVIQDTAAAYRGPGGLRGGPAANLRKALFAQHMGLTREQLESVYPDPVSEASVIEMRRVAQHNTEIYEELFGALPSDAVGTWAELAARRRQTQPHMNADFTRIPEAQSATEALKRVQGYLVQFPLDFLAKEDLAPSAVVGLLGPVFT